MGAQPRRARYINCQIGVEPALHSAAVIFAGRLAAGQHHDAGRHAERFAQHLIGQTPAGMGRDDEIPGADFDLGDPLLANRHSTGQAGPGRDQGHGDLGGTVGNSAIHGQGGFRSVIQEEQKVGNQAVATGQIEDPAAAISTPGPAGELPGLKQLLAGNTVRLAQHPGDAVEERGPLEVGEVVMVEAGAARRIEAHRDAGCAGFVARASRSLIPRLRTALTRLESSTGSKVLIRGPTTGEPQHTRVCRRLRRFRGKLSP